MGLFRRITTSISSSVDHAITKVENHDAIIAAAIKSTQSSAAKARVRLARVQKDGQALHQRALELKAAEDNWARRAKTVATTDKTKALECMRRRKQAQQQLVQVRANLQQHAELESQVHDTLKNIQGRLAEMNQQRNMMRSRESVAEAMRVINNINGATTSDIEETFDRWEVLITESEIISGNAEPLDTLTADFMADEDRADLEAELEVLLVEEIHEQENGHESS